MEISLHSTKFRVYRAYVFPVLGKIAEFYLDAVDSEELMTDAYKNTTISVEEFEKLEKQGKAVSPHVVKKDIDL